MRGPAKTAVDAIVTRQSMRAYLPKDVPDDVVRSILAAASRAPSGTNTQPWKVYVVRGAQRDQLCAEILSAYNAGKSPDFEYDYYPSEWRDPYLSRRRANGWGLYGALGIRKGDRERTREQHGRNYRFFDAPVGLIFTIDRDLEIGSWLDYGMFLQSIMIAAREFGLDTCAQQAFAQYYEILHRRLSIPRDEMVICGMAVGYADMTAPENRYRTEREPLEEIATFVEELAGEIGAS
ncbi:hypothetical protein RA28_10015 [Ruegeria sp. ANG-S4]|nr:hypothetical protein RA28_10015 [Ruegeria sp. ANG-S4]